jgi:hypothetical protein
MCICIYNSLDQTVHFSYVTSLWVEGKQVHVQSLELSKSVNTCDMWHGTSRAALIAD